MGKVWLVVAVVAGSILIGSVWFVPIITGAHMGGGMMGPGMMGPRGQQRPGYGDYSNWQQMQEECMEMMEHMRGWGGGSTYPNYYGPPEREKEQKREAISEEEAVSIIQGYLERTGNPNLRIGKVEKENDGDYLVEITTKDGSLVDKLEVNQFSGWFHSIYK